MSVQQTEVVNKLSPYRWVVVITWSMAHIYSFIILESLGLLLPGISKELNLSPIQEGWLGSSAMIGNLLLSVPAGWLLSRFNPKMLTTVTLMAGIGFVFLQGWAPVFFVLLVGRFLYGATSVARQAARPLLVRQWVPPSEIVIVNSLSNLLWGLVAVGFLLTPFMLNLLDDSWRHTLYLHGGISLVFALIWQILGKERITEEYTKELDSQEKSPITSLLRYKELWIVSMGLAGIGINWAAYATFWPSYMLDNFDLSLTNSAIMMALSGAISAVAGLGLGLTVRRVGRKRLFLLLTGSIMALSSVGLLWTGSFSLLIVLSVINGFSWTFFPITSTIPYELKGIKPREIAVAMSLQMTAMWGGTVVGPILAGFIHETAGDLKLALTITSLFPFLLAAAGILLPKALDARVQEPEQAG